MRPYPAGSLFLLLCLGTVFVLELARGATGDEPALLAMGALPDAGGLRGQWWRLLSYAFLHWNWAHQLANAALLAGLAPALERRAGAAQLWGLFLVAAVASGAAIALKHQLWPAAGVTVGASGGAFAVLGAVAWLLARDPSAARRARLAVAAVLVGGLALSLAPGISLLGHLTGLAVGAGWAAGWSRRPRAARSPISFPPMPSK